MLGASEKKVKILEHQRNEVSETFLGWRRGFPQTACAYISNVYIFSLNNGDSWGSKVLWKTTHDNKTLTLQVLTYSSSEFSVCICVSDLGQYSCLHLWTFIGAWLWQLSSWKPLLQNLFLLHCNDTWCAFFGRAPSLLELLKTSWLNWSPVIFSLGMRGKFLLVCYTWKGPVV